MWISQGAPTPRLIRFQDGVMLHDMLEVSMTTLISVWAHCGRLWIDRSAGRTKCSKAPYWKFKLAWSFRILNLQGSLLSLVSLVMLKPTTVCVFGKWCVALHDLPSFVVLMGFQSSRKARATFGEARQHLSLDWNSSSSSPRGLAALSTIHNHRRIHFKAQSCYRCSLAQ